MSNPYRILVTGSRDWPDVFAVWQALAYTVPAVPSDQEIVIVHGACPTGADQMADRWARSYGAVSIERHPADWDHCTDTCPRGHRRQKPPGDTVHPGVCADYCPSAGPRRNASVVSLGADICLAFVRNGSRGASHTAALAEAAGIPTRRFTT